MRMPTNKELMTRNDLLQKNGCPSCTQMQDYFEASGVAFDDYDGSANRDGKCINPKCGRTLLYTVPLFAVHGRGGWCWKLEPINAPEE
jgi:hypothetical protein